MVNLNIDDCKLFIIRHAEAQKNIEKMHGGGTQDLTPRGVVELKKMSTTLRETTSGSPTVVYHQKEGRSQQTAQVIGEILDINVRLATDISGVGLGIIANLNEDELLRQYPHVSKILSEWRTGGAKLEDYPDIPGREHMNDFAIRIGRGLQEILQPHTNVVIIGTTSTINMLNHLLQENGKFVKERYDFVSFPFSGINTWQLSLVNPPHKTFSSF